MNNLQAKQMLKQVDCHGIPRGYNGGYSELYEYCLKSIEKLNKIELLVNSWNDNVPWATSENFMHATLLTIKDVLEQE